MERNVRTRYQPYARKTSANINDLNLAIMQAKFTYLLKCILKFIILTTTKLVDVLLQNHAGRA